ncbi:MAG: glutamate synthase, partial [Traorella sp.]
MKRIQVKELDHRAINELLSQQKEDCFLENCLGQRYIASGMSNINIKINGIPGNDLGAYLDGAIIEVFGNGQDGVG